MVVMVLKALICLYSLINLDVHSFGSYINEFKELYSDEEVNFLMSQWHKDYKQNLKEFNS
tara:strand:+ start:284 stop:463 length:180 start_codon:yes stop_codon:yes gene_type:complete